MAAVSSTVALGPDVRLQSNTVLLTLAPPCSTATTPDRPDSDTMQGGAGLYAGSEAMLTMDGSAGPVRVSDNAVSGCGWGGGLLLESATAASLTPGPSLSLSVEGNTAERGGGVAVSAWPALRGLGGRRAAARPQRSRRRRRRRRG